MFATWRCTVCELSTRCSAISRSLRPRAVHGCVGAAAGRSAWRQARMTESASPCHGKCALPFNEMKTSRPESWPRPRVRAGTERRGRRGDAPPVSASGCAQEGRERRGGRRAPTQRPRGFGVAASRRKRPKTRARPRRPRRGRYRRVAVTKTPMCLYRSSYRVALSCSGRSRSACGPTCRRRAGRTESMCPLAIPSQKGRSRRSASRVRGDSPSTPKRPAVDRCRPLRTPPGSAEKQKPDLRLSSITSSVMLWS